MNRPKIAIVVSHPIQHFCPWFAALAKSDSWEVKVLFVSAAGYEPYFDAAFGRETVWSGITLDFPHVFLENAFSDRKRAYLEGRDLLDTLDEYSPDAVLVFGYGSHHSRATVRWARGRGCPIVYQSDSELRQARHWRRRLFKRLLLPSFFRRIDVFLTVGDANERYLEHYGCDPRRFVRSGFPIDLDAFDHAIENREALRSETRTLLQLSDRQVVVGAVGKLIDIKSQDHLVEAIAKLGHRFPELMVLIVGSGDRLRALKELARVRGVQDRILFAGFVPPSELPAYYAACDLYVHPSAVDPHPLAVSEASYMGLPLIVSDRCGSWGSTDDLRPGINGYVYQWGQVDILAQYIARLSSNVWARSSMGERSREIERARQSETYTRSFQAALVLLDAL